MEIFKLFESTIPNVEPGHPNNRDLRRDQLIKNYDEAIETLRTLIKAKKSEIAYRRDLIEMLDKSKVFHDNKLTQAKQSYSNTKRQGSGASDSRSTSSSSIKNDSYSVEHQPPYNASFVPSASPPTTSSMLNIHNPQMGLIPNMATGALPPPHPSILTTDPSGFLRSSKQQQISSSQKTYNDPMNIPLPPDSNQTEMRSSLDQRLSNFLKTFGGPGGNY